MQADMRGIRCHPADEMSSESILVQVSVFFAINLTRLRLEPSERV